MVVDGYCKFGDVVCDGYVCSEGVGLVIFKWFDDVLVVGDLICVVICGGVINNDGDSSGLFGCLSVVG